MNVMGNDVNFFRDQVYGQVPGDKPPESVPERICAMCAISVVPDCTMCAHNYHTIDKSNSQQVKVEIMQEKDNKTGDQDQHSEPTEKTQPVFSGPENIQPEPAFFQ